MIDEKVKVFVKAAELGSISKAAYAMHMSVNTASRYIQQLEDTWHIELMKKNSKGIILTKEGKYIYENAKALIESADEILFSIPRNSSQSSRRFVRIYNIMLEQASILINAIKGFTEINSNYDIQILPFYNPHQIVPNVKEALQSCDLLISPKSSDIYETEFSFTYLYSSSFYCAVHRSNPLYENNRITVEDLADMTVCMLKEGLDENIDRIRAMLPADTTVVSIDNNGKGASDFQKHILIFSEAKAFTVNFMKLIPLDIPFRMPIGIICEKEKEEELLPIISCIKNAYVRKTEG